MGVSFVENREEEPMIDSKKYPIPRVRHHVSSLLYLPAHQHKHLPAWYPPDIDRIDWSTVFANGAPPTVLDIGCGRGGLLLAYAMAHPDVNIFGIEVRDQLVDWINGVIRGEQLGNAHARWYSVVNGIDFIVTESIDRVFYLFPDPWPKNKHHKRRAFTVDFLNMLHRVMRPDAVLYLATDRPDVDEYQGQVIAAHGGFVLSDPHDDDAWGLPGTTDQQRFCDRKNIPYVRRTARRITVATPNAIP